MKKKIIPIELLFSSVIVIFFVFIITIICLEIKKEIKMANKNTEATIIINNIIENINSRTYEDVNEYIQDFSGVGVSKKINEKNQSISIIGNEFDETFFGTQIPDEYILEFEAQNANENFDIEKNITITLKYNEEKIEFSTILEKENIEECNSPVINDYYFEKLGFNSYDYHIIPIKYSNENKCFEITQISDKEWYNYSAKKWAKVLIFSQDADNFKDLFIDENGFVKNTINYDNITIDIKNYIYVWIPNFTIKDNITYFRYGTSKKAIKPEFVNYNSKNLYLNKVSEEVLDISEECSFDGLYGVWKKLDDENDIYYSYFNTTKYGPINIY